MSAPVPQDPTAGELDCLAVLWDEQEKRGTKDCALKLSEIHQGVCKRRAEYGETPPALTTISTYLRSALGKQLLVEVRRGADGTVTPLLGVRTRGALSASRSPQTAYMTRVGPSDVFRFTFEAIVQSYPPGLRHRAIVDFAAAMDLPPETIKKIEKLVTDKTIK